MENIDDGTLAFLNIPRDENYRQFDCEILSQSKLINSSFQVIDFIEDVSTRYSKQRGAKGQTLLKIKQDDGSYKKFFTGSKQILYICREIKKRNAFPRRVKLLSSGNRYWFE